MPKKILVISIQKLLVAIAVFSALAIGMALIGQYVFGLHPCELCVYQRIPYAIIIIVGSAGYFIKSPKLQYILVIFCALLFLSDAIIAIYHTGVEMGIFPAPTACSSDGKTGQTLEEMRAAIFNAPLVTCSQAMFYFLGLSMAAWNAIAASFAFIITVTMLKKQKIIND